MLGKLFKRKKKQEGAEDSDTPEKENDDKKVNRKAADADTGEDGDEEGEQSPELAAKKAKRKKLMLVGFVVLMLLAIGGGAYMIIERSKHAAAIPDDATAPQAAASSPVTAETAYYTLPEFLVNLNTTSKQASFLKMTVVLQLKSQEDAKKVEAALPRVLDNMNTYLREMRATDLSGSAGIYRLRDELLVRVNKTVAPVKVDDVLFKEIIVQ